jgi:hypothetical protein
MSTEVSLASGKSFEIHWHMIYYGTAFGEKDFFLQNLFLGAFSIFRKATASFFVSVRPSILLSECNYFDFWGFFFLSLFSFLFFQKSVENIQVSLKSDKNNGHYTWRPVYIFDHVSLSSSYNEKFLIGKDAETVKTCVLCSGTFFESRALVKWCRDI